MVDAYTLKRDIDRFDHPVRSLDINRSPGLEEITDAPPNVAMPKNARGHEGQKRQGGDIDLLLSSHQDWWRN